LAGKAVWRVKRAKQIINNAESMMWQLTADQIARIDEAIESRGVKVKLRLCHSLLTIRL